MTISVLVVDDDDSIRSTLVDFFESLGHTARGAGTATEGRRLAMEHAPDVVLLDLRLPDADGLVALEALRADDENVAVILLTGFADVQTAVRAMHHGAADVLEKPVDLDVLATAVSKAAAPGKLRQELEVLRAQSRAEQTDDGPPPDPALARWIDLAARNADATVLLQGETGTGKGFIARQIHDRSARKHAPFVEINCASLSPTFFESDLFGHERGAFTDARQAKRGLLEVADDGTLFLDEVVEMSMDVQPRFLKVLEERTFRRLGSTTTLRTNARLIVASHQPLQEAVSARRFRADLYYRLQVLTITLPALRERPDDIVPLAELFLPRGATLHPSAHDVLLRYSWPGNIRELRNAIWRAAILADGTPIGPAHLGLPVSVLPARASAKAPVPPEDVSLHSVERQAIQRALSATEGNRTRAARLLGIARSTLLEKIRRYGM